MLILNERIIKMTIFKKPESNKKVRRSNLVIGYYMGKAIVKDEENNILYFIECEECHAPEGTYIENEALTPITSLTTIEQEIIKKIYQ